MAAIIAATLRSGRLGEIVRSRAASLCLGADMRHHTVRDTTLTRLHRCTVHRLDAVMARNENLEIDDLVGLGLQLTRVPPQTNAARQSIERLGDEIKPFRVLLPLRMHVG